MRSLIDDDVERALDVQDNDRWAQQFGFDTYQDYQNAVAEAKRQHETDDERPVFFDPEEYDFESGEEVDWMEE